MYFLALSQAPPPVVIEMATKRPVTMVPTQQAAQRLRAEGQADHDGHGGAGSIDGIIISLIAATVSMSTARE
jgi:hypothetical protein